MNIQERVNCCFKDVLGLSPIEMESDISPEDVAEWDSLVHVTLLMAIEEDLDVEFESYDLEELESYKKIVKYVGNLVESRS